MSEFSTKKRWGKDGWMALDEPIVERLHEIKEPTSFKDDILNLMEEKTFRERFEGCNVIPTGGSVNLPTGSTVIPSGCSFAIDYYKIETKPKATEPPINTYRYWVISGSASPMDDTHETHWLVPDVNASELVADIMKKVAVLKSGQENKEV